MNDEADTTSTRPTLAPPREALLAALFVLTIAVLARSAWLTDDAQITFRTVLNWLHGYGPRFNVEERVQAYTHPLWFLLLAAGTYAFDNVFVVAIALASLCTLAVVGLVATKLTRDPWVGALAALTLLLSKAFVDFATSGLENPLLHALLVAIVVIAGRLERRGADPLRIVAAFLAGLVYLVRADATLLVAPLVALLAWGVRRRPRTLAAMALAWALPILAWTTFSLVYYGFPFPNTAYAKLGTGISAREKFVQGLRYVLDSFGRDAVTLPVVVGALAVALRRSAVDRALALGVTAYLAFVVLVGGDFMSGRFFTSPLVLAVVILARTEPRGPSLAVAAVALAILGAANVRVTLWADRNFNESGIGRDGIADERGYYFHDFALVNARRETYADVTWDPTIRSVSVVCGLLGTKGVEGGPSLHLVDECGLADPLLARLPATPNPNWRVGHFTRTLPDGYFRSVDFRENAIRDPELARYYEAIRIVTREPLFTRERFRAIAALNLGQLRPPAPPP
jgi:arabinofuranosyltransferase